MSVQTHCWHLSTHEVCYPQNHEDVVSGISIILRWKPIKYFKETTVLISKHWSFLQDTIATLVYALLLTDVITMNCSCLLICGLPSKFTVVFSTFLYFCISISIRDSSPNNLDVQYIGLAVFFKSRTGLRFPIKATQELYRAYEWDLRVSYDTIELYSNSFR